MQGRRLIAIAGYAGRLSPDDRVGCPAVIRRRLTPAI
jgi:hypothetical protein